MRLNFQFLTSSGLLDKTGAAVAWLCALHCLAMPFVISSVPLLGVSFLVSEEVEYVFVGFCCAFALLSLLPGYFRRHRRVRTLLLFVSGVCFVIFADRLFEDNFLGKTLFVVAGAVCITSAHFVNRRLCRDCLRCAEDESVR